VQVDDIYLDFYTGSQYVYPVHMQNNNFIYGNSFWTETSGAFAVRGTVPVGNMWNCPVGSGYPYGGTHQWPNMYQEVTIVDTSDVLTNWVDAGSVLFKSCFWGATNLSTPSYGLLRFASVFLSGSDTILGSISNAESPTVCHSFIDLYVNTGMMPALTRKVRYELSKDITLQSFDRTVFSAPMGQMVLPQAIDAAIGGGSSANTTTTIEAFVTGFNAVTTSLMVDVPTSLGMSAEPKYILGLATHAVTPNYAKFDGNYCFGSYAHSTDYTSGTYYASFWTNYADSTREQIVSNSGAGPGPEGPSGSSVYRSVVRSVYPGYLTWQAVGTNIESFGYVQFTLGGSLSVDVGHIEFKPQNVGSLTVASFGFKPDLLFFVGANRQNANAAFTNYCAPTIGFVDCRSLKHHVINRYAFNVTIATQNFCAHYSNSFMGLATVSSDWEFLQTAFHVNSRADWGFTFIVDSDTVGESINSYQYTYTAFKFDDPQINFRVDYFNIVGSVAVASVQTNSLDPQFILINALNTRTIAYCAQPNGTLDDDVSTNKMFFGCVHSGTTKGILMGGVSSATGWKDGAKVFSGNLAFYDVVTGTQCQIESFFTGTGGFHYSQTISTAEISSWDGMKVSYCAVGVAANAPAHFQGPDGVSVFLTNKEYYDDLLLGGTGGGGGGGPSSPPPGGGNAIAGREFWTDQNRDFPTQINTVRDFPIF